MTVTPVVPPAPPRLLWDLFCRVVDNYGDIGVCWRLARELARRGHRVRLRVDDARALRWMAPGGEPGVRVLGWDGSPAGAAPGDVVVEAFGCNPPEAFVAAIAQAAAAGRAPAWINLEYLSAEAWVERCHGLASPVLAGPAAGLVKWFFYPGYTAATGGLLRENGLAAARADFDAAAWLAARGLARSPGERLASVFCYPGAPLAALARSLAAGGAPWLVATAPGAATDGWRTLPALARDRVRHVALPWMEMDDYDRLLWTADLNLVRGEDSWVRAQWAGRPFVWQAYEQDDGAHHAKVESFVERLVRGADAATAAHWRQWHACWNAAPAAAALPAPAWTARSLDQVGAAALTWRARLESGRDLVTNLVAIALQKR